MRSGKGSWLVVGVLAMLMMFAIGCDEEDAEDNPVNVNVEPNNDELSAVIEDVAGLIADPQAGLIAYWNLDEESMIDTSFTREGLTYTFDHTFYDENGNESEIYIPNETVRARRATTIMGTLDTPQQTVDVDHNGVLELINIAPEDTQRTIEDYGERTVSGTVTPANNPVQVDVELLHEWSADNIVIERNVEETYPVGDMTLMTGLTKTVGTGPAQADVTVDIASSLYFDGSQYARVVMEYYGTFWIDLETGEMLPEEPTGL